MHSSFMPIGKVVGHVAACLAVLLTCALATPQAHAVVIIHDTFSLTRLLEGSTPDVSPGTSWHVNNATAAAEDSTDGALLNMGAIDRSSAALIGFNLVQGRVYSLSVDVQVQNGGGFDDPWAGMGFTTDLNGAPEGFFCFASWSNSWMLLRFAEPMNDSDIQTFAGPSISGGANHELMSFTNTGAMRIVLDTTNPLDYQATWFFNDVELRTASLGAAPAITGVYLSQYLAEGTFDNFLLTDDVADSATIPEPATASLALLGMGGLMMRRRRMA